MTIIRMPEDMKGSVRVMRSSGRLQAAQLECRTCGKSVRQMETKDEMTGKELFDQLRTTWLRETGFLSSPHRIAEHPCYRRIIGMGLAALPFILEDLASNPDPPLWGAALREITGESVWIAPEDIGKPGAVVKAWLVHARQRGWLPAKEGDTGSMEKVLAAARKLIEIKTRSGGYQWWTWIAERAEAGEEEAVELMALHDAVAEADGGMDKAEEPKWKHDADYFMRRCSTTCCACTRRGTSGGTGWSSPASWESCTTADASWVADSRKGRRA